MKMSLETFREELLEGVLSLLWRQWTLLGIPGHDLKRAKGMREHFILDPEALLLVTSELGRFDARLFDEVLNWLRQNGRLINIQRLKGMIRAHGLGNRQVLAGMSASILEKSRLSKWGAIQSFGKEDEGSESLFRNLDGSRSESTFAECDHNFKKFGLIRGNAAARAHSTVPEVGSHPELLLIKLRALFGVNARAEILAALLSVQVAHPAALARQISYLPRSVQDILNEMALSGHVMSERSRERYFSLRPGDWSFLLTWSTEDSQAALFPRWIEWRLIFQIVQQTLSYLYGGEIQRASPLMAALRLQDIYENYSFELAEAGLAGKFALASTRKGLEFQSSFITELSELFREL